MNYLTGYPDTLQSQVRDLVAQDRLGAMLLMYDENVRYVTSTLTPGWNRLKPGLRYVVLIDGQKPRQSAEPDSEAAA